MSKLIAVPIPIEDMHIDKESNITRSYTSGKPSAAHDGTPETVNINAPIRLNRDKTIAGAIFKGIEWDYKVATLAATSLTPAVYRFDKKVDGTTNAALAIDLTADNAFAVAAGTTELKAEYSATYPAADNVEANDSSSNAVASTSEAEYRAELVAVIPNTSILTLYGATAFFEVQGGV